MSSLHQPITIESFKSVLKGRRRSSIRPVKPVSCLFAPGGAPTDGSAISDEPMTYDGHGSQSVTLPLLSPLSLAHMSGYTTNIMIPRHHDTNVSDKDNNASTPTSYFSPTDSPDKSPILPREHTGGTFIDLNRLKVRFACAFYVYFLCGWGDGVTGTVLPYLQDEFHLTTMTSSLLFAGSTCGFATGTLLVEPVMTFLGRFSLGRTKNSAVPSLIFLSPFFRAKNTEGGVGYSASQARYLALVYGSMIHACFFIMMGARSGFAVMFLAYAVAAFARAIITATTNEYLASSPYAQSIGYAYGLWSFGGVISPLICQAIISTGVPWYRFYYGSLVLSGINTAAIAYTFLPTLKEFSRERQKAIDEARRRLGESSPLESPITQNGVHPSPMSGIDVIPRTGALRRALRMPYQWAFSLFAWLYSGSETTTQGFMVTYLLSARHANPQTAGYVTSGFWGGITVGRFLWGYYTPSLSFTHRKYIIHGCIAIALAMQLLIWFVDSNIENAFSASIIGAVFGPIFPACLGMATSVLPTDVHMVTMALISSFASLGSAIFPFVAGSVLSIKGVQTLAYITVPQAGAMFCLWALFPSRIPSRHSDD